MTFRGRNNFTIIVTVAVLLVMGLVVPVSAALTFGSIAPNSGPTTGGTPVTITGLDFVSGGSFGVTIGGTNANGVYVNPTTITATTPAHAAGAVNVVITNNDGQTVTGTNAFTYTAGPTFSTILPSSGPITGGTPVTITGSDFVSGGSFGVTIGGTNANGVYVNPTTITATTPAHTAGAVNVVITNNDGQTVTGTNAFTYTAGPTFSTILPSSGPITGGTPVTITGSDFVSGGSFGVTIGGTNANGVYVNPTTITATTPAHTAGAVNVVITNNDGQTVTGTNAFTYTAGPTFSTILPSSGPITGGTPVTITGANFVAGGSFGVTIGGANANGAYVNPTTITATTPAHAAGAVNVVITNNDGQTVTGTNAFTYTAGPTFTSIAPPSGSTAGGTAVTITGSNFVAGGSFGVTIGGANANGIYVNPTTITATTPAHAAGAVNVIITNNDGQTVTGPNAFTYSAGPTFSTILPSSGPTTGGTPVTMTGSNFVSGGSFGVTIGGTNANGVYVNPTTITATTPAHAAGAVNVIITNNDGQTVTGTNAFTYSAGPTFSTILPSSGPTTGGTPVTMTGANFVSGGSFGVTIGGTNANGVYVNPTTITATTPAHAAGAVNVIITNNDGQTVTGTNAFTYSAGPTFSTILPSSGPTTGGTPVTITGANFVAGGSFGVTIGGANANGVYVNPTTITATTPAHAAGAVNVVITNNDGQTVTGTNAFTFVTPPVAPTALFSTNVTSGSPPLTVGFIGASTGSAPLSYAWDFTNDGITDSTLKNPIHSYLTTGSYTANLTVTNTAGARSVTHVITVTNTTTKIGIYQNGVWNLDLYGNGGKNLGTDTYLAWDNAGIDLPIAGDWNGDGRTETGIYRPGAGFYLKMDNGSTWNPSTDRYLAWDNAGIDLPIAGDWNGDGITETGVYRPGAGFYLKMDNGGTWNPSTDRYLAWDNAGIDLPIAGDWNGDGRTETGVYRPGAGFYLKMDNGSTWNPATDVYLAWDNAGIDLPIAGDWNGDGRTETGVYRPGVGFYLKMDAGSSWNPATDVYLAWDNAGIDRPLAGDWNGDGRPETSVYRPGAGFYLKMDTGSSWNPSTVFNPAYTFRGEAGGTPIVGDWDGNGNTKIGVYKNGAFSLDVNGNRAWDTGSDKQYNFALTSDFIPIVGDWNGDRTTKIGYYRWGYWSLDYYGQGIISVPYSPFFGQANDLISTPVVGDWDGNGKTRIGLYQTTEGQSSKGAWYLDLNGDGAWDSGSDRVFNFGENNPGLPVIGDWNGDGKSKIGVFRDGSWRLDYNGNGSLIKVYSFGTAGSTPVIGDWNGDGRSEIGIYKPVNGDWNLDYDGNGANTPADKVYNIGTGTPVVGKWT